MLRAVCCFGTVPKAFPLSVVTLTNSFGIVSIHRLFAPSSWICSDKRCVSRFCVILERRQVFSRRRALKDISAVADVAGDASKGRTRRSIWSRNSLDVGGKSLSISATSLKFSIKPNLARQLLQEPKTVELQSFRCRNLLREDLCSASMNTSFLHPILKLLSKTL